MRFDNRHRLKILDNREYLREYLPSFFFAKRPRFNKWLGVIRRHKQSACNIIIIYYPFTNKDSLAKIFFIIFHPRLFTLSHIKHKIQRYIVNGRTFMSIFKCHCQAYVICPKYSRQNYFCDRSLFSCIVSITNLKK